MKNNHNKLNLKLPKLKKVGDNKPTEDKTTKTKEGVSMEEKTNCPCDADLYDNCFVEKTEIEGKPFESYMCFDCGMTSNSYLAFDSDKLEEYTKNNSELMNDLKIMDEERGIVWFPSVINMGEKGIIYPDGVQNRLVLALR